MAQLSRKGLEPRARSLFQSVKGLGQLAHELRMILVDEAGGLVAVHSFG